VAENVRIPSYRERGLKLLKKSSYDIERSTSCLIEGNNQLDENQRKREGKQTKIELNFIFQFGLLSLSL